jgi:hypothetical protein
MILLYSFLGISSLHAVSYNTWRIASSAGTKVVSFPLSLPEKIRKCNKVHENLSLKFRKLKTTQTLKHSTWFESWTKVCYAAVESFQLKGYSNFISGLVMGEIMKP